jgi:hypothetical protein
MLDVVINGGTVVDGTGRSAEPERFAIRLGPCPPVRLRDQPAEVAAGEAVGAREAEQVRDDRVRLGRRSDFGRKADRGRPRS